MIAHSKLPVLWALMSDQHQMLQSRNSTRWSFFRKKKNPFSSLLRFVHLYWKVTQHREKVCFLLLAFFSVSLITRYFYSVWKKSCNFSFTWQVSFFSFTFHHRDHTSATRFALIVPTDAPWGDTQHKAWFPTKLKTQMTKVNDPSTSSGSTDSSGRIVYGGVQCEDPEDSRGREEAAGLEITQAGRMDSSTISISGVQSILWFS